MVASGTNAKIAYKLEATHGTTPASPDFTVQRAVRRNINLKKATLETQESSPSRQRADVRHGFQSIEGEVQVELGMEAYNDWLLWSVGTNAWFAPASVVGTTLSVTGTTAFTRGTGNWIDDFYRPGDWVVTTGFPNGANNGLFRVLSVTASVLTITGATLVNEAGDSDSTVAYAGKKCAVSSVSQALKSFTLEREILDLNGAGLNDYSLFRGCAINQLSVSARPEALVSAVFRLIGMTGDINEPVTLDSDATYTAPATNSPFASIDGTVYIGTGALNTATQFDLTIDNQRTLFPVLGATSSIDVYEGVAKCTGSIGILLGNNTRLGQFQNETVITDGFQLKINELGTVHFMVFNFYRTKFTVLDMDPGQNGPVVQNINWEALEQTFTGSTTVVKETMHIQRSTAT